MTMDANLLYMDTGFVPAVRACVLSVRTHGFCYGTGCEDGIRGYWNEQHQQLYLFRLRDLDARLRYSCKRLLIELARRELGCPTHERVVDRTDYRDRWCTPAYPLAAGAGC
jgi:branched-subunit amino acid aminotransferase/4-amino-4-deoxychorismate lyase